MHQNDVLREIKNVKQLSFISIDVLRAHKGIAQQFKYKARNQNATNIDTAMNSKRDPLYNLIRNNRNNTTQKISIWITEHFSKPKEILNDKDLVDPSTGVMHKNDTISIPTNEIVYDNKYHHSNVLTLYPRSSIGKLLGNLTAFLIQNREYNMASLEGASNHRLEFINKIHVKFLEINSLSARRYIPTPKKLANKKAIINPKNNDNKYFYMQLVYLLFMMRLMK